MRKAYWKYIENMIFDQPIDEPDTPIFASQVSDPLPSSSLGGFSQVFKHSAYMRLTSFASYM